jgi:hypothetical protein
MQTILKGTATLLWLVMIGVLVISFLTAMGCSRFRETTTIDPTTGATVITVEESTFDAATFLYITETLMNAYGMPIVNRYIDIKEQELQAQIQRYEEAQETAPEDQRIAEYLQEAQQFLTFIQEIKERMNANGGN